MAPIQPLVWELPYAVGVALKRKKKKKKSKKKEQLFYRASFSQKAVVETLQYLNLKNLLLEVILVYLPHRPLKEEPPAKH